MPRHIKLIARIGNGLAAVLFGLLSLVFLSSQPGLAFFLLVFCALAIFNIYVIETCIRGYSEEEWLKTEIRKSELRKELTALGGHPEDAPGQSKSDHTEDPPSSPN